MEFISLHEFRFITPTMEIRVVKPFNSTPQKNYGP